MKTKEQKIKEVNIGNDLAKKSKSLILINFSDIPVNSINELKTMLHNVEAKIKVMKKTLFSIIFKENHIDIDVKSFSGQIATIFSNSDITDTSGIVYKFSKSHIKDEYNLNMVAGYNLANNDVYNADKMIEFGKLPSRDVLLAQLSGVLSAPMRVLAIAIKEVAIKIAGNKIDIDIKEDKTDTVAEEKVQDAKNEAISSQVDKKDISDGTELNDKKNDADGEVKADNIKKDDLDNNVSDNTKDKTN